MSFINSIYSIKSFFKSIVDLFENIISMMRSVSNNLKLIVLLETIETSKSIINRINCLCCSSIFQTCALIIIFSSFFLRFSILILTFIALGHQNHCLINYLLPQLIMCMIFGFLSTLSCRQFRLRVTISNRLTIQFWLNF